MNILTFDIEDWFHILDNNATKTEADWKGYESRIHQNIERIFELLDDNQQKATFFCLGWVAKHYPEIIRRINDLGHEVACHSNLHQLAYEQTPEEFEEDLKAAMGYLEDVIGQKVIAYRAPGFSLSKSNNWVFEKLIEAGIEIDCSIFPASRAHGGYTEFGEETPTLVRCKSGIIKEFPINTHNFLGKKIIFSGGGYFRLLPYGMIKYFTQQSPYVMTYFHPRDMDGDQPMIPGLSLARKFKSYYGLRRCEGKLIKFIRDYKFISLGEASDITNWDNVPQIEIN